MCIQPGTHCARVQIALYSDALVQVNALASAVSCAGMTFTERKIESARTRERERDRACKKDKGKEREST